MTIKVWPNPPGTLVPNPETGESVAPGQEVERTAFILRSLKRGDLVDRQPTNPLPPERGKSASEQRSGAAQKSGSKSGDSK